MEFKMFTESVLYQQIYNTNTTITIHQFSIVLREGIEISRSIPHTKTLCPGDDYSNEDADTQKMCDALWTPEVIAAYQQSIIQSEVI
jgi:hypothetical protein